MPGGASPNGERMAEAGARERVDMRSPQTQCTCAQTGARQGYHLCMETHDAEATHDRQVQMLHYGEGILPCKDEKKTEMRQQIGGNQRLPRYSLAERRFLPSFLFAA